MMEVKQKQVLPSKDASSESPEERTAKADGELKQLLHFNQFLTNRTSVPIHTIAEIVEVAEDEEGFTVKFDGVQYAAEKAASCLLAPHVGDTVLISGPNSASLYIIAIIKQAAPEQSELAVKGRLSIRSEAISLQSKELQVKADTAQCVIDSADYVGKELRSTISISRIVGKVYEVIADRLSQMSRHSVKITEQVDQTRAGTIDYQADDSARIHSKYTMVTGKELVKVDSDQIHMG